MLNGLPSAFAFGPFRLIPAQRRLEKNGHPVRLGGRAFDVLVLLAERAGVVVSNREILESVWRGVTVDESSLRFHVKNLRRALATDEADTPYVVSVSGRGYCFAGPIERLERKEGVSPLAPPLDVGVKIPARRATIIGRDQTIDLVSRELSRSRLVTIAGPGGVGKTTLALATAEALSQSFRGAVVFVDLAPISGSGLVVSALASALGAVPPTHGGVEGVLDRLRDHPALLLLDNCEQVIDAVAVLADRILRETRETHVLVTSREALRLPEERVHRLMPLECPPVDRKLSASEALHYAAVQLFADRAAAGLGGFSLDDTMAPVVAGICRRLDGIPLAIELAAARVEFLGLTGLAQGLNEMFAVLTEGRRLALPRHRTLRATLDWSYDLLSTTEQAVLRALAVFRAAFTLDAALAIASTRDIPIASLLDAMAGLVAKSVLVANSAGEVVQYRLLEPTRLYAAEKLKAARETATVARRHADHYVRLLEAAPHNWASASGRVWLTCHGGCIDDLRAALDWCFSENGNPATGFRLIEVSARLWFQLSLTLEYGDRVEAALRRLLDEGDPDAGTEMRLQASLGHALWYSAGEPARVADAFRKALALAERAGDVPVQLQALWGIWASWRARGRYGDALAVAERHAELADQSDDEAARLMSARILALTHHHLGDQVTARRLSEEVLRTGLSAGSAINSDFQLGPEIAAAALLVRVLWLQGLPDQAKAVLQQAIRSAEDSQHWYSLYYVLCFAGCPLAFWTGDLALAQIFLDRTVNRAAADRWRRCWDVVLSLRKSGEQGAMLAAFLEPRIDLHTARELASIGEAIPILVPTPSDDIGEARWSLPEVMRVNAELLLLHKGPAALEACEAKLRDALDLARRQEALSWELRAATSLARVWRRTGRISEGRDLLRATCDRFAEGFQTFDVLAARRLMAELA